MRLYEEAVRILPAGVSSNARLWRKACPVYAPCSIFIDRASGARIWDVDGNEYIDYRLGFGPVILGHSYPALRERMQQAERRGSVYALDNELEITVGKKISSMVPCAEMVRFSVTGTEATMHAIRLARAYTAREKIVKFEGHYHGAHDYVLFSTDPPIRELTQDPYPASTGIPKLIHDLVFTLPWNDYNAVEKLLRSHPDEVATVITEPIMGNAGVIAPKPGYLKGLRQLCDEYGVLLIFDEVKTGFRVHEGGAQKLFGVTPDLATFAKSVSNGYPLSVIAGRAEIMEHIGPKKVVHGGTYASNPISLTAADVTLNELSKRNVIQHLHSFGKSLMKAISDTVTDAKIDAIVQGFPQMFQIFFTEQEEISNYRDWQHVDLDAFGRFQYELLLHGVMLDEDNGEPVFTSRSHGKRELNETTEAVRHAVPAIREKSMVEPRARFSVRTA